MIAVARREDRLATLVQEMGGEPHSYVGCDLAQIDQIRSLAEAVARRADRVDILVNNAGAPGPGRLADSTPEQVEQLLRVNLVAPVWCIQLLLASISRAPRGPRTPVIVNVASMAGRIPVPSSSAYTASKFGLVGLTESLWAEMRDRGVRVMVVNPGLVHTEGFPMDQLLANPLLRWMVMDAGRVAEALCDGIAGGRTEVRVQGWWHLGYYFTILQGPLRRRISHAAWKRVGRRPS